MDATGLQQTLPFKLLIRLGKFEYFIHRQKEETGKEQIGVHNFPFSKLTRQQKVRPKKKNLKKEKEKMKIPSHNLARIFQLCLSCCILPCRSNRQCVQSGKKISTKQQETNSRAKGVNNIKIKNRTVFFSLPFYNFFFSSLLNFYFLLPASLAYSRSLVCSDK